MTRLGQSAYVPAINNDIAAGAVEKKALAQEIDATHHVDLPPYTAYVACTIFMHTLAFNEPLQGISSERLRYSILGPATDISFIDEACKKFIDGSAYLDDRPGTPMRFLAEANLHQIIRQEEDHIDAGEVRAHLNDRIRQIMDGKTLEIVLFPGGPFDVPDEVGNDRPRLVVLAYDAVAIGGTVDDVPELINRIYTRKGSEGLTLRMLRNNLVFVIADEACKDEMRRKTCRRLALRELTKPERLIVLAEYQQRQIREIEAKSEQALAIAIQQCFRHVFYPSRNRIGVSDVDLVHTAIDIHSASDQPGAGQRHIIRALRDLKKLRLPEDEPDSPAYVRDRTPLKKGQITTFELRNEFRRDPALPILIGDDIFIRGVRRGIEKGEYVYRRADLLFGPGDPSAEIVIDEQSVIFTMAYAKNARIWPRETLDTDDTRSDKPDERGRIQGLENVPSETAPSGTLTDSFVAEGVLKEALIELWEKVRDKHVKTIAVLTVRMFEHDGGFRLLDAVGAVPGAEKSVTFCSSYETSDGGSCELEFKGPIPDAQPVKEFLGPQFRAAASGDLQADFTLTFTKGFSMQGDATEELTERLTRYTSGVAYVSATAEVKT